MTEKNTDFLENFSERRVENEHVNFDQPQTQLSQKRRKSRGKFWWSIIWKLGLVAVIFVIVFFSQITISSNNQSGANGGRFPKIGISNLFAAVRNYFSNNPENLKGGEADRINILLLGIGGTGHDGPYLTDTMILASIQPSTKKIALISIPRDLYVAVDGQNWDKINAVNSIGESRETGSGGELVSQVVGNLLSIPIQYYARIDFNGFEKLIDDMGGITVTVDRTFIDEQYPAENFEYQVVNFKQGTQKMNGDTALKFARSRHGNNGEGSDFARSLRQQKILMAVKNKATSFGTLTNPTKISKMLDNLKQNLITNLQLEEISQLARLIQDIDLNQAISYSINDAPDNFLVSGYSDIGAYILKPKTGNFDALSKFVREIFGPTTKVSSLSEATAEHASTYYAPTATTSTTTKAEPPAKILVLNGTIKTGHAGVIAQTLKKQGFDVPRFDNAPSQDYEKTVIYTLDKDSTKTKEAATKLKTVLDANVSSKIPEDAAALIKTGENFDFVVILGIDSLDK